MIKRYMTKYEENGKRYAVSWKQINLFSWCFCFDIQEIEI